MTDYISVDNLVCSYIKENVLKGISFRIKESSICFIMGNNGSGKTTLLNCMLGNIPIKKGNIFYKGQSLTKISRESLSRIVAYVPQNFNMNCEFKVKDYLVLGRNPYIKLGNPTKADYEIVEKYAIETNVDGILGKPFNTLSGGQRQLVAITRALVQETPVIIMDEPMSALDLGKQAELLVLLKNLKEQGKTIVLTSHNPNHCFCIPDSEVCLIDGGVVKSFGNSTSVFTKEIVEEIYGKYVTFTPDRKFEITI